MVIRLVSRSLLVQRTEVPQWPRSQDLEFDFGFCSGVLRAGLCRPGVGEYCLGQPVDQIQLRVIPEHSIMYSTRHL